MRRLRLRVPSPALVVSIVALIVALGGTSYAAFSLPNGSVGTPQLKNKAVTNNKLAPLSVGTAKIRNGAVTATQINPTGLTVPNATNAVTATRLTGIQVVRGANTTVGPNSISAASVTCPTGTVAIGGEQLNLGGNLVSTNEVGLNGASVLVFINNLSGAAVLWHPYAVCAPGSSTGASVRSAAELSK